MKSTLTSPRMLLLCPMSPHSKLVMQPGHLKGYRGVLCGIQGSLVCEMMELRFLLGSWALFSC